MLLATSCWGPRGRGRGDVMNCDQGSYAESPTLYAAYAAVPDRKLCCGSRAVAPSEWRCRIWVKLRKARYEQMSSALPPTTDIPARGPRGRPSFQIQHSANMKLRATSPARLQPSNFDHDSCSTSAPVGERHTLSQRSRMLAVRRFSLISRCTHRAHAAF